MNRNVLKLLGVIGIIALTTGCGTTVVQVPHKMMPSDGKALVTILNPFNPFVETTVEVYDGTTFQGHSWGRTCLQFETEPGQHVILAKKENWAVISADLEANKRYYIHVRGFPGIMSTRVILDPVTKSEDPKKIAEEVTTWTTYEIDPATKDANQGKREKVPAKVLENHEAGKTKFATLSYDDGC